jgi:hypothetical protein
MALGLLWLLDAALQGAPALFTADWWRTDLAQSVMGEPMVINHSIFWAVDIIAAHAPVWNSCFVAIQAALGLALITGRFDRVAIVASIPWALGIWWVGEGFGMIPTGFALLAAGSPGPVLLYPLIGILAWPTRARPRSETAVSQATGMTAWAVLWAGQALLQIPWSMPSGRVLVANIEEYSQGQTGWLGSIARTTTSLALHHPVALSITLAIAQVAIGIAVFVPRARRSALTAGIAVSVVFWFAFQYLGGILGGDATDPGAAPLMILLAFSLWPAPRVRDPKRSMTSSRVTSPTLAAAAVSA